MLPQAQRTCRIIAVNHDSRWSAYAPIQSLRSYGQTILDSIDALRQQNDVRSHSFAYVSVTHMISYAERHQKDPIIFVGYSFGGILVKKVKTDPVHVPYTSGSQGLQSLTLPI